MQGWLLGLADLAPQVLVEVVSGLGSALAAVAGALGHVLRDLNQAGLALEWFPS